MEIAAYLAPVDIEKKEYSPFMWGYSVRKYAEHNFPNLEGVHVALIGVGESRNAGANEGCKDAPNKVKESFYQLASLSGVCVADLGNLILGHTANDTYHALAFVCGKLLEKNIIPFILGGSQDLTYANYLAYQPMKKTVNMVCIDRKFDIGQAEDTINANSYISKIIAHTPNLLFNFCLLAYQTHFVAPDEIEAMKKMYFDLYRLGQLQTNMEEAEPAVRNADIISFDISSIRKSDAPATYYSTPNGLYGEEACQIFRYAGMSDKISSVGIYELNPLFDKDSQTAQLAAQLIWYFLDGFIHRKNDFPIPSEKDYIKYLVAIKTPAHELTFYKSLKTNRWWMEVPYVKDKLKFERHRLVPCSYEDYQLACTEEIPDRWWQAYQKLN